MLKTKSWHKQITSVEKICSFLSDFIETENITLAIALRSSKNEEIEFYKQFFNNNVTFYKQSEDGFSSYNAACESNVTVALYSALALEMIGAGIKVLYVNPYGHKNYVISDDKCEWYLHKPNMNEFTERLQLLLKKDRTQFFLDNRQGISYINSFDYQKPMHKLLRKSILEKINES
jgi:surface carbohydrate biosynthesis protein